MPPLSQTWRLKRDEKKQALGEAVRPVGGKVAEDLSEEDVEEEEADEQRETETDLIPFSYHSLPKMFAESVVLSPGAKGVIDFTAGDGVLAEAVLETNKDMLYLGFCHTEKHCDLLRNRLAEQVMAAMQQEGNPLFNIMCVPDLRNRNKTDASTTTQESGAKLKAAADRKQSDDATKNRKRKKNKKGKKRESSSSSSSSSPAGGSKDD